MIRHPRPEIYKALEYQKRGLEFDNETYKKEIVTTGVRLWAEVDPDIITTYQGFKDLVIETCNVNGIPYRFCDQRVHMPAPRMGLARGFRGSQQLMFFQLMAKNRSGLLKAPTRFGKSTFIQNICRVFPGMKTVVTTPGTSLINQMYEEMVKALPGRDIKGIFQGARGRKYSEDITVVSMDSLHKVDQEGTRLLIIDEPHSAVSNSRVPEIVKFRNARILGTGATVSGRFDNADILITGLIGPVLVEKTFKEAVAEGAICPIVVYMLRLKYTPFSAYTREIAYRKVMYQNAQFNTLIQSILLRHVPSEWQTMIFIDEVKQADLMTLLIEDGVVAVASRMNKEERKRKYDEMVANITKRCICTDIYATGITFPDLRVIINAAGGGGSITATQKPGRLAQCRPGKTAGYLVDFLFVPEDERNFANNNEWRALRNDSCARLAKYKANGFDVRIVNSANDIKFV